MVLKHVGPVSIARITGTLYAILGLVVGGIVSLVALVGGFDPSSGVGEAGLSAMVGVSAIVVFPVIYGAMGFIATLLAAWLYNLIAGVVGGIELDLQ